MSPATCPAQDTAALNSSHSSADSEPAETEGQRRDIDTMFSVIETMRKIRANISRKPDKAPEEKIAIQTRYQGIEADPARHDPTRGRLIAKGPGKAPREIAMIAHRDIKTATALSRWVSASVDLAPLRETAGPSKLITCDDNLVILDGTEEGVVESFRKLCACLNEIGIRGPSPSGIFESPHSTRIEIQRI
jgi:hypothetical protein